jgi:putative flippase GtrA
MHSDVAALKLPPAGQASRFLAAGLVNTAFSYGVYAACLWLGIAYPLANLAAMIGGVLIGFVTQGHFVFRRLEGRRFPSFVLSWLALWGLNVLLISLLLPLTRDNAYLAGAIALAVIVPLSFLIQKHLVFGGGSGR